MSEFIERLTVKNFGCVKDVSVELTPLHAFIGPNDSGKSTLLRAMRTLVQLAGDTFYLTNKNVWSPFDPALFPLKDDLELELRLGEFTYGTMIFHSDESRLFGDKVDGSNWFENGSRSLQPGGLGGKLGSGILTRANNPEAKPLRDYFVRGARLFRLDPDALRMPSQLISSRQKARLQDERG
ncbi:MAG: AAA family ATPase, partial [Byssovorax sp.]